MFNSLRTEKHRIAFSKGNVKHPSEAFVDFMINDQTSTEQFNRIREISKGETKILKPVIFLFRLRHTSESHSICAEFNLGHEKRSKKANAMGQQGF